MAETKRAAPSLSVSTLTIIKVTVALLMLYALYLTTDIVILVVAAIFLASAVTPTIDRLEHDYRIPRAVSMLSLYAIIIGVLVVAVALIIPPLVTEAQTISAELPRLYAEANG